MDSTESNENICTVGFTGDIPQPGEAEVSGISQPEREEPKIIGEVSKSSKGEKKNPSLSTSKMVVESITSLKKRFGATEEAISKYIEDNYDVNVKARSRHIKQFLIKGVEKGLFEKVGGDGATEKFKIKKEGAKKTTEKKRNVTEEPKDVKKVKKSIDILEKGLLEESSGDGVKERFKVKKESAKKATENKRNVTEEPKNVKKVKKIAEPEKDLHENGRDRGKEIFKVKKENTKKATEGEKNLTEEQKDVKKVKKSIAVSGKKAKQ